MIGAAIATMQQEDELPPALLYRGMTQSDFENLGNGLPMVAADPSANRTLEQAVFGTVATQYISTSKDPSVAADFARGVGPSGTQPSGWVAAIDPRRLTSSPVDVSIPGQLQDGVAQNLATREQLVLVPRSVPPTAVVGVVPVNDLKDR